MKTITLPKRKIFETPRLLLGDAYTIGSNKFESDDAKEKSVYYITFRRRLHEINPVVYGEDDNRIVFVGLQRILERLFYDPITHEEIDEAKRFLAHAKVTMSGFKEYEFPERMWRDVVDYFNGRPPILIEGLPEGSVLYPNEPAVKVTSLASGMGVLAAWFESKLLHVWSTTERVTQDEHFLMKLKEKIRIVDPEMSEEMQNFYASIMITDFGDRAGICSQESEELGMVHLYTYGGTDTFSGAYQAWKNANESIGVFSSVNALAHRNVQSYEKEVDCYNAIYNSCKNDELISMVDDCYDAKYSVRNYLLPLAIRSKLEGTNKVVIARPDSSKKGYTTKDQVLEICDVATEAFLFEKKRTKSGEWKFGTTFHFIDGDGKDFDDILDIIDALIARGYGFYSWGLFGVGGNLRNHLKRDNLSAKYALCSVGAHNRPVVKFSETVGKTTLPGNFKLLRTPEALAERKTVVFMNEEGTNALVEYFNGGRINKPFGIGQDDDFLVIKARIKEQLKSMPQSLETPDNNNYPASDLIVLKRKEILHQYAPTKETVNY